MNIPSSRKLAGGFVTLALGACLTGPQNVARLSGTLQLAAVDGLPLPFDAGRLPPPPGFPDAPVCHILISRGTFSVVETSQFVYAFRSLDSCSGREIGGGSREGTFSQTGSRINFVSAEADGTNSNFRGTFDGRELRLTSDGYLLLFSTDQH